MFTRRPALLALLAATLCGAPQVLAQESGVVGDLERVATTTPQEKMSYAADTTEEMRQAIKDVSKMLEAARREGDLNKLQCLNNRLTSIRALLQVSESAEVSMKEALSSGETERADHEFRKITVARGKAQQLRAEAEQCITDTGLKAGQTVVKADEALDKPSDETLEEPTEIDYGGDPAQTSPFL